MKRVLITEFTVQELAELEKEWLDKGIEIGKQLAEQKEWCSAEEAAEMLGLKNKYSLSRIRNEANSKLVTRKVGNHYEYLIKSIEDHKNSN